METRPHQKPKELAFTSLFSFSFPKPEVRAYSVSGQDGRQVVSEEGLAGCVDALEALRQCQRHVVGQALQGKPRGGRHAREVHKMLPRGCLHPDDAEHVPQEQDWSLYTARKLFPTRECWWGRPWSGSSCCEQCNEVKL